MSTRRANHITNTRPQPHRRSRRPPPCLSQHLDDQPPVAVAIPSPSVDDGHHSHPQLPMDQTTAIPSQLFLTITTPSHTVSTPTCQPWQVHLFSLQSMSTSLGFSFYLLFFFFPLTHQHDPPAQRRLMQRHCANYPSPMRRPSISMPTHDHWHVRFFYTIVYFSLSNRVRQQLPTTTAASFRPSFALMTSNQPQPQPHPTMTTTTH